jgi:hypothetical protein
VKNRLWAAFAVCVAVLLVVFLLLARSSRRIDDPDELDTLHEEIAEADTTRWVDTLDPERAALGYTLVLYRRRVPMLIDLNGRVVHTWSGVRVVGRARLTRAGHLYVIGVDDRVKEYDWEGNLVFHFEFPSPRHIPHHDLIQLRNGHYLVLGRSKSERRDYLREVDRAGRMVWRWDVRDHGGSFPAWDEDARDPAHINSIHELGENRWFAAGDTRFRPGNLLVSARNQNTILIIDKPTGEIVWQLRDGLDYQHEAVMIPEGRPEAGLILVFNNGFKGRHAYRRSRVQAFHPLSGEVAWEYGAPYFFSSVTGSQQPLWNGNVLVASSQGGRVFEVTPEGDVVWQWSPPFLPMRPLRYARDHCPQLARLGSDPPSAVADDRAPFISRELYSFLLPEQGRKRWLNGSKRRLLDNTNDCRELVIPPDATVTFGYGLDDRELDDGRVEVRFAATAREIGSERTVLLLDDVVRSGAPELWREATASLQGYAHRPVELCLDAQVRVAARGGDPARAILWGNPKIRSPYRETPVQRAEPSERERRLEEEQLRAIGYVQ